MLIVYGFVLLLLFEAIRRHRSKVLVLEYQYQLFALRDELRKNAGEMPGAVKSWLFQYQDSTITKSITLLPGLSLWHIFGLVAAYKDDERIDRLGKQLQIEFSKPANQKYKEIEDRLTETIAQFLVSRHFVLFAVSVLSATTLYLGLVTIPNALREAKNRSLQLVVVSPETSTLYRYAPQAS